MTALPMRELLKDEWHADYSQGSPLYEVLADAEDPDHLVDRALVRHEPFAGTTVLEFGCGPGRYTRRLSGRAARWIATDLYPKQVARARQNVPGDAQFASCEVASLPLPNGSVDLAFAAHVFGTLHSDEYRDRAMAEVRRVLRPDGCLWLISGVGGELRELVSGEPFNRNLDEVLALEQERWGLEPIEFIDSHVRFADVETAERICRYFWNAKAIDEWFRAHPTREFTYRYLIRRSNWDR